MKLLLPLLLFSTLALGQSIQNAGFEVPQDTNRFLPQSWSVDQNVGFTVTIDSTVAKSGRYSLLITNLVPTPTGTAGFSQTCTVQLSNPTLVHLRGFIKTDNPAGVGVWWNSWQGATHKGFAHSNQQLVLQPTVEWQALDLVLPTSSQINRFTFGAYLNGAGRVWFDDLRFETGTAGGRSSSAPVRSYLAKVISLVKKHALVRDSIPWPQTESDLLTYAQGMQTVAETYPILDYFLNQLRKYGDNHSFFMRPQAVQAMKANASAERGDLQPQAGYVGDGVAYLFIPPFSAINAGREMAFASQLQRLIGKLDSAHTVRGWIVDLRQNGGGNMFPMIAGLGPLTGEGTLGYFLVGKRRIPWGYRHGKSYVKKTGTRVPSPYRLRQPGARVAVLIGPGTGSSGENTAISFQGLPNVRTFGQRSAGFTTSNANYELSDGAMLFLAEGVGQDRTGKTYFNGLVPDEEIKEASTGTIDPAVEAAKSWIVKK
ncbi:hypothetical protein GCM10027347_50370 [Larkinella harenae]